MPNPPFAGLYVHYPYCVRKCVYCDFNSFAVEEPPQNRYLEAVVSEMRLRAPVFRGVHFNSFFFGGGTPSLWDPECVRALISEATGLSGFDRTAEVTIEANPGTVDADRLGAYLSAGVNRLSVGVQSLVEGELLMLGRVHGAESALEALRAAKDAGFSNISADVMYGVHGQTPDSFLETLQKVVSEGVSHISMYALTVATGTPLKRLTDAGLTLPDEDEVVRMYLEGRKLLADGGFAHYEISNWARPGRECVHNVNCWTGGYYMGLGAGAHGHHPSGGSDRTPDTVGGPWSSIRYSNFGDPGRYLKALERGLLPEGGRETVDAGGRGLELIYLGLRMMKGFDPGEVGALIGEAGAATMKSAADRLMASGLLVLKNGRYALTEKGELFADRVALELSP